MKRIGHNHVTRDIKPPGQCPACDKYHSKDWTAEPNLGHADQVSTQPHVEGTDSMTTDVPEACWKKGCDAPITHDYWCEKHHTERRERINKAMIELRSGGDAFDQGPIPDPHIITVESAPNYETAGDRWWWKCSCGAETGGFSRLEGVARGAGTRHRNAAMKAQA